MATERDQQGDALIIPTSLGNVPLQVVRWSGQRASDTTGASTKRITLPTGSRLIEITAVTDTYINFGDGTVEATSTITSDGSRYMLAGVQVVPVPLDPATGDEYTHVAIIQASAAGIFQVEKIS